MHRFQYVLLGGVLAAVGAFLACGPIGSSGTAGSSDAASGFAVNPKTTYQIVDGFGAADAWTPGGSLTAAEVTAFFDPVNGIGLSLLRVGIDVNGQPLGGANAYPDITAAASFGARVWASPWSPPASDKSNDDENQGGSLCAGSDGGACTGNDYESWANILATFPQTVYAQTGVHLFGISAQNEPDNKAPNYPSCIYSAAQMTQFIEVLGPKLLALSPTVRLIAPEPENWADLWDEYGSIAQDSTANPLVGVYATHDYSYAPVAPPSGIAQPIWETEVSTLNGNPSVAVDDGLNVAQWIYNAFTKGGASAWHYWWLIAVPGNSGNQGLLFVPGTGPGGVGDVNSPPKRFYTVGNFSKFVRPGYKRIDVSGEQGDVSLVAFESPDSSTMVIVAINPDTKAATFQTTIAGSSVPAEFTPWTTSAADNLTMQPPVGVDGGVLAATLPAQSVTTFVSVVPDAGAASDDDSGVTDARASDAELGNADAVAADADAEVDDAGDGAPTNDSALADGVAADAGQAIPDAGPNDADAGLPGAEP